MVQKSHCWGSSLTIPKFSWNDVIFKDLFIKGIYGREIFESWYKMISMLDSGLNIDGLITHEFIMKISKRLYRS